MYILNVQFNDGQTEELEIFKNWEDTFEGMKDWHNNIDEYNNMFITEEEDWL